LNFYTKPPFFADLQEEPQQAEENQTPIIPLHNNIRGAANYQ
jgi:hypothetical protein